MESKKRSSNFSAEELYFLVECLSQQASILENKKTDSVSSQAKRAAWRKIEEAFESNPNCLSRKSTQLEIKWKGLKKIVKSKVAEIRKARKTTGGGPPVQDLPDIYQKIYDMIPQHFERIENEYDNDSDLNLALSQPTTESKDSQQNTEQREDADELLDVEEDEPPLKQQKHAFSYSDLIQSEKDTTSIIAKQSICVPNEGIVARNKFAEIEHKMKMQILNEELENKRIINQLQVTALKGEIYASKIKADYYKDMILMLQRKYTALPGGALIQENHTRENMSGGYLDPCSSMSGGCSDNGPSTNYFNM